MAKSLVSCFFLTHGVDMQANIIHCLSQARKNWEEYGRKGKKVKVKFSHTRYRALGRELIPMYRQSARR